MKELTVPARAKLNLTLDITGMLPGGYHALRTVMQTVTLCDDVSLSLSTHPGIRLRTNLPYLPRDSRNLAVRAAALFMARLKETVGVDISIRKRIPVGAGLGGGSANAAAVLRGLNELYSFPLSDGELETMGESLGSDVPFCVRGGTVLCEGRGEIMSPAPNLPDCGIVLLKPDFSISTPELFSRYDGARTRCHPDNAGFMAACADGSLREAARRVYNVLEDVLPRQCTGIFPLKGQLMGAGALGVSMTGTGSAVFGLFPDVTAAEAAAESLRPRASWQTVTAPI